MNLTTITTVCWATKDRKDIEQAIRTAEDYFREQLISYQTYKALVDGLQKLLKETD